MRKYSFILLTGLFVFYSCTKEENKINDGDVTIPIAKENFNFYKSAELYNEAQNLRSENYSDAFEIEKVERTGNLLNVTVSYEGSCETNKFDVIWDGIIMESWPVQTRIIIRRSTSNCNSNGEIKREILSIDLVELIDDEVLVEGAVFHISNASKIPDEVNADAVVTHENQ